MNKAFLARLRCPQSGLMLMLEFLATDSKDQCDYLVTTDGRYRYPIRNGIPRFVSESNYANNFGMQWNYFAKTQLDSNSGHPISAERFWKATSWSPVDMKDKWVLDVGCGSGRFAEIALSTGAHVVALDYSSAVDACWENLKAHPRLYVVQGDIYALPFIKESFDYVYSLGVLQHTPDVAKAFAALPPMVVKGGRLCADYYWKRFRTMLHAKYMFRPATKRMDPSTLFELLQRWVPTLLTISMALGRIPLIGKGIKRIVPVADYTGRHPLSGDQLKDWALLDTFDMLAPIYDNPQTVATVRDWFEKAGLEQVETGHWGHLVGRGVKPA
jgi:SAM-dependent methyltransferase